MKSKDLDGPASHKTGEFKSAWLIHEQEEEAAHKAMMEAYERPYKPVQDSLLNDWTGHRYGKYWATYGEETPIPPVAEASPFTNSELAPYPMPKLKNRFCKRSSSATSNILPVF